MLTIPRSVKICSFDIFDTVLTRIWANPHDLFHNIEDDLIEIDIKWKTFASNRIAAEFELRSKRNFLREVALAEIYHDLKLRMNLTDADIEFACTKELAMEKMSIVPNPQIINYIDALRKDGKRIIFVSDIYLQKEFIESLLMEKNILHQNDNLYVSSDIGVQKATGDLFKYVLEKEKITRKEICHIGDNSDSDYKIPTKIGIKSIWYENIRFTRYEEKILKSSSLGDKNKSLLAGIYRNSRLACPYSDIKRKTIWDVSVNVSGPLMIAFVAWILGRTQELKLNRIYFLSRDGQILLKLAEIIKKKLELNINLRYLYVSRQALLLPAITVIDDEELDWILAPTSILTLRIICQRLNMHIDEVSELLREYGYDRNSHDKNLSKEERTKLRELFRDERIQKIIMSKVNIYRPKVYEYFRQEGLTNDDRFAIVDIGWNGTLQRSISRILEYYGYGFQTKGLYFGLRRRLQHKDSDLLSAFFSDYKNPVKLDSITYIVPLIELFAAANHGGVSSYESIGNLYKPVLKKSLNIETIDWGVLVQQEAMIKLAENITCSNNDIINDLIKCKDILSENLAEFMLDPTYTEARAYGDFPLAEEQNESYHFPLARKFNFKELIRYKFWGYTHHHNEWLYASIALSNKLSKRILNIHNKNIQDKNSDLFGKEISLKEGFGPEEGPYPDLCLPKIIWGYGPSSKVMINSDNKKDKNITFYVQNYLANQKIIFLLNGVLVEEVPVSVNFANKKEKFQKIQLNIKLNNDKNIISLCYSEWENSKERPLAVLFSKIIS